MNGRAYDPELGRFLSVDPFMQAPLNAQSLNAYSYVMNNPLAGTDPTGYTSKEIPNQSDCYQLATVECVAGRLVIVGKPQVKVNSVRIYSNGQTVLDTTSAGDDTSQDEDAEDGADTTETATDLSDPGEEVSSVSDDATSGGTDNGESSSNSNGINPDVAKTGSRRSSGKDLTPTPEHDEVTTQRYDDLRVRVMRDASENPDAVIKFSEDDLADLTNYMVMMAKSATKFELGSDEYSAQFGGFDSFIYSEGLTSTKFDVAGHGVVNGGDLNYVGVGALSAAYGYSQTRNSAMVAAWNVRQWWNGEGYHNIDQISRATPWAQYGYDRYNAVSQYYSGRE